MIIQITSSSVLVLPVSKTCIDFDPSRYTVTALQPVSQANQYASLTSCTVAELGKLIVLNRVSHMFLPNGLHFYVSISGNPMDVLYTAESSP
ncbi:MAG: hypothetical protein CM1200mP3_14070 [Chloroflexota bacterium]|nr:MAG: hypothetical protein CM1200mP3_14070 [Chloroflexota bacterium]